MVPGTGSQTDDEVPLGKLEKDASTGKMPIAM